MSMQYDMVGNRTRVVDSFGGTEERTVIEDCNRMRVFYLDPALKDDLGHHANSCRCISAGLRSMNVDLRIYGYSQVEKKLQVELEANPHFRSYTYWETDGDPVCGWLNAFFLAAARTREDLDRLTEIGPDDLVYLNSGKAAQLLALVEWMSHLPVGRVPTVVIEFGIDPGLDVDFGPNGLTYSIPDLRKDPRSVLFRHAASRIPPHVQSRLWMSTFDPNSSHAYSQLLEKKVIVLPLPRVATTLLRTRAGKRPIHLAVLGHQRPEKGYHLVPEISRRLLASRPDVRFLVHNGDPNLMKRTQQELHALAKQDLALTIDERIADDSLWSELLDASDLIICPYTAPRFMISYSAVAAEAIANAIPVVVPANTSMARLVAEFGNAGMLFDKPEPRSIVEAIHRALNDFDRIANLALIGARKWCEKHGSRRLADALLQLVPTT